jgi:hypothetical protein
MLGQGMVPVLLLTVHGHIRPIDGSGCHGSGVPMARRLARGFHVSLGQGESKPRGSDAFDDVTGARVRRKNVVRGAHLTQGLSIRLGCDGVYRSCRKRLSCHQCSWRVGFTEAPMMGLL